MDGTTGVGNLSAKQLRVGVWGLATEYRARKRAFDHLDGKWEWMEGMAGAARQGKPSQAHFFSETHDSLP